jgi:replication factor C subunit 3/5
MDNSTEPWVEKYRPNTLDDIVLDSVNKTIIRNIIKTQTFPNLLFYGPPGTGKTTTILNLITDYQKNTTGYNKSLVIHLNASDERGIDTIRNVISEFAGSNGLFQNGLKFVILDEIDSMTKIAQQALKILIQNINTPTRFCLITNYLSKIDLSLRNYCVSMRFNQLPIPNILQSLQKINMMEGIGLRPEQLESIQKMYRSDMRSMINYMQTIQVNMQTIITNKVWAKLTTVIETGNIEAITNNFNHILSEYNMQVIDLIKTYFNYIIRNHEKYVTSDLLNLVEKLLHCNCKISKYLKQYFIIHIKIIFTKS